MGKGVKMPLEEFRRCLLSSGMGKSLSDTKQLFYALGGSATKGVDIDLLRQHVKATAIPTSAVVSLDKKKNDDSFLNTGRADRKLRDAMRKPYGEVSTYIQSATDEDGYINADALHQILLRKCLPLTYQDFRLITQQVLKNNYFYLRFYFCSFIHTYVFI